MYVQTQYGWYILLDPATEYRSIYRRFFKPHLIAQSVLSWVEAGGTSHKKFLASEEFKNTGWNEANLKSAVRASSTSFIEL